MKKKKWKWRERREDEEKEEKMKGEKEEKKDGGRRENDGETIADLPRRCTYQKFYSIYSHSKMHTSNEGRDRHASLNVRFPLFH